MEILLPEPDCCNVAWFDGLFCFSAKTYILKIFFVATLCTNNNISDGSLWILKCLFCYKIQHQQIQVKISMMSLVHPGHSDPGNA